MCLPTCSRYCHYKLHSSCSNINAMFKPLPLHTAQLLGSGPDADWPAPAWVGTARTGRMAYRRLGAETDAPWLVLHGGPGGSSQPELMLPFRLDRHRLIIPDQRGAGLSTPLGRSAGNHTDQLVADLERLRVALGIARWSVLAGSWGTVLALCYARRYPERVDRLVLRGAFGLRLKEIRGLLHPHPGRERVVSGQRHWPRGMLNSLPRVLAHLEQVLQVGAPGVAGLRLIRCWSLLEQGAALRGMWRSAVHAAGLKDVLLSAAVRRSWARLRRRRRQAEAGLKQPRIGHADRRGWQKFRIQSHYLRHKGFLRPGALDRAVGVAATHEIPSDWIHGRFDAVCPPANSRHWLRQTEGIKPGLGRGQWPLAGHLAGEPAMRMALGQAVQNPPSQADPCHAVHRAM